MNLSKNAVIAFMLLFASGISASAEIANVEYTPSSGIITVHGRTDKGEKAFINVLKGGNGDFFEELMYQDVEEITADDGTYDKSFRISGLLSDDASHKVTVKESVDGSVCEYIFALADANVIEGIKDSADIEGYLKENRYKLGLCLNGIEGAPDFSKITSNLQPEDLNKDADELYRALKRYMVYDYIVKGKVDNLFEYKDILNLDSFSSMKEVFTDDVFKEINQVNATGRLKNKAINNQSDFEKELNEACVLAIVKNPDGYENIKRVCEYFASEIGIDAGKGTQKLYTSLQNKDFSDYGELKDAFNKAADGNNSGGGSSGGGGSSNSSSGKSSGIGGLMPYNVDGQAGAVPVANNEVIAFSDLSGYDWAKEAIEDLCSMNVVSGKEVGRFYPGDRITRSEFVKTAVNAFGIKDGNSALSFADTDESRWDYRFINSAYSAGIIKGISDDYFGCADPITRQDIAVIINRLINSEGGELADRFADDRAVSEYAYDSVYSLRYAGILKGDENNMFNPLGYATRAEAAVIVYLASK